MLSNKSLQNKIEESVNIIETALKKYGENKLAISFNGGKDSTVLMEIINWIANKKIKTKVNLDPDQLIVFNTKNKDDFEEIKDFIKKSLFRYNIKTYQEYNTNLKTGLKTMLEKNKTVEAIFAGMRKTDKPGINGSDYFLPSDPGWPKVIRVSPILNWEYKDVWDFLLENNVPFCKLYSYGYTSIGSKNNTQKNPFLKVNNYYRPAWELSDPSKERAGRK
ncbi:fad synthase [Anaeramoeba ignava]|uniref:FAD synthase n=1 Tax=Anaeramoeba ignava TaxID=1746090 RepID=A0A9Q0LPG6_ANAIG|nr:fad synthase [Anaeramoeba ignava]